MLPDLVLYGVPAGCFLIFIYLLTWAVCGAAKVDDAEMSAYYSRLQDRGPDGADAMPGRRCRCTFARWGKITNPCCPVCMRAGVGREA